MIVSVACVSHVESGTKKSKPGEDGIAILGRLLLRDFGYPLFCLIRDNLRTYIFYLQFLPRKIFSHEDFYDEGDRQ